MRKYLSLFAKFISLSWMSAMEYRANFISWMLVDLGWSCMDLLFTTVLINFTQVMGSWNRGEMLVVLGVFRLLVVPVWGWMYQSFNLVPRYISEGRLDLFLTKPADSQFLISSQQFGFSIIPSFFTGIGFVIYGFFLLGKFPSFPSVMLSIWLLGVSTLLAYGVYFSMIAYSLYVERLNNIQHIFTSLYEASRYPAIIFSPVLRFIFLTILPISVIVTVPAQALFSHVKFFDLVSFHLLAIIFFFVSRFIWNRGLRRYSSASS